VPTTKEAPSLVFVERRALPCRKEPVQTNTHNYETNYE
jgi:hypothetical protein